MSSRRTSRRSRSGEQLDAPADVEVAEHRGRGSRQAPPPRRRRGPGRARCAARSRRCRSSTSATTSVGVAGGEPLEGGVEHVAGVVADRVADGVGERAGGSRGRSPRGVAVEGGGERRHVVGAHAGDASGPGSRAGVSVWYRLNCSSYRPTTSQRSSASRHLVGHGAEVLADDRRRRARRLGGDHGQQLLARVAHVRALGRRPCPRGSTTAGARPSRGRCAASTRAGRRGRRGAATARGRSRRPAPGSCGGKPQSWPSAKNSSGGAPTVMPGGEQVAVGPRLVAVRVAADRQVEGERGAPVALDARPAGGRRGTGRAGGCARRAPRARRRRPASGARRGSGRSRRRRDGRRRSGRCPAWTYGSRSRAASSSWRRRRAASSAPVDERRPASGTRRGRQRGVVEVHLVPVQPADRRVRARVERVVEERGVQRQGGDDVDAERGARPRRTRRGGRTTAAASRRSHSA